MDKKTLMLQLLFLLIQLQDCYHYLTKISGYLVKVKQTTQTLMAGTVQIAWGVVLIQTLLKCFQLSSSVLKCHLELVQSSSAMEKHVLKHLLPPVTSLTLLLNQVPVIQVFIHQLILLQPQRCQCQMMQHKSLFSLLNPRGHTLYQLLHLMSFNHTPLKLE
jgi:hypothetical protein